VRLPEHIEHVGAFTRASQHCEISQKSIRDSCSEIFWRITFLNLVTEFPYRSLQVLKTLAGKHSAPFRKSEKFMESQLRLGFGKIVCTLIKKVSPVRGDFLSISLNYHASQSPNHQRPEELTAVAPDGCGLNGLLAVALWLSMSQPGFKPRAPVQGRVMSTQRQERIESLSPTPKGGKVFI
jgi:hypothetical protein